MVCPFGTAVSSGFAVATEWTATFPSWTTALVTGPPVTIAAAIPAYAKPCTARPPFHRPTIGRDAGGLVTLLSTRSPGLTSDGHFV
jgi:hypothetical protein